MPSTGRDSGSLQLQSRNDAVDTADADRESVRERLDRLDRLAGLLDDRFRIPLTDIRIGIDPLLGLLPGGGDWVAWVAGVYVLWESSRLDVPNRILLAMAWNILVDLLVGYVPVAGDLFDIAYRSNRKNVELLFDHFEYRKRGGSERELPDQLPADPQSPWKRYLTAFTLVVGLTLLAVAPLALLWWLYGG